MCAQCFSKFNCITVYGNHGNISVKAFNYINMLYIVLFTLLDIYTVSLFTFCPFNPISLGILGLPEPRGGGTLPPPSITFN